MTTDKHGPGFHFDHEPVFGGEARSMARSANILREMHRVEEEQARARQMTREVREFFEDARRAAAEVLIQVTEQADHYKAENLKGEMRDFLDGTINCVRAFVDAIHDVDVDLEADEEDEHKDLEANLGNLEHTLERYRAQGTARPDALLLNFVPRDESADDEEDEVDAEVDAEPDEAVEEPADEPDAEPDEEVAEQIEQPAGEPGPEAIADSAATPAAESASDPVEKPMDSPTPQPAATAGPQPEGSPALETILRMNGANRIPARGLPEDEPWVAPLAEWFKRLSRQDEALRDVLTQLLKANAIGRKEAGLLWDLVQNSKGLD